MQKTNFKTRLLALLTAVFMVIMCVPFAAFADDLVIKTLYFNKTDDMEWTVPSMTGNQNSVAFYSDMSSQTPIPGVTQEGKVFKGWARTGAESEGVILNKGAYSYAELEEAGLTEVPTIQMSPIFEDAEEEEPLSIKNIIVTIGEGETWADGYDEGNARTWSAYSDTDAASVTLPVATKAGKEFVEWVKVGDESVKLEAGKAYSYSDLETLGVPESGDIFFKAVYKDAPVSVKNIIATIGEGETWADGFDESNTRTWSAYSDTANVASVKLPASAKAGKEFVEWVKVGDESVKLEAGKAYSYSDLETLGVTESGDISFKAVYKDAPVSVKNIIATIGEDETWADGFDESNTRTWSAYSDTANVASVKLPVSAKAGKEFVEWVKVGEESVKLEAGKAYSYSDLEALGITECGDISFKAVYKDVVATTTQKNIAFMLGEGNTWADNFDNSIVSRTWTAYSDTADVKSVMPPVVAKEGKEFVEWVKVGEESVKLAAGKAYSYNDLKELGVPEDGDIAFVPVFKDKEAIAKNVIFQVSQVEGAKWATKDDQEAYGQNSRYYQTWSNDAGKYTAPAAAKDGKDFDYWVCNYGDKKIVIRAGEEFNFDTLTAKGISATEAGDFAFNPVFKDKASSSSSSASSSSSSSNTTNTSASNTTTTSASQKQVVKPAAAPANTTKVLPKTGATNAAPLIGGSLAVVALLMGYGVYGLVLRKKD